MAKKPSRASTKVVKDGPTVAKHVQAIHVGGDLSLIQRKLANALLYHAYPDLPVKEKYTIKLSYLCELIELNGNDWPLIKESLKGLRNGYIEFGVLKENGKMKSWGIMSLLAEAKVDFVSGTVLYSYGPLLRESLYDPAVYELINLGITNKFGSKYALALYENCASYRKVGSTGWMAMEVFRQLMGCADDPYYDDFKYLNAKVIKPAVREVNETSDIEVTPEFKRQSRKVSDVRLLIHDKRDLPPLEPEKKKPKKGEGTEGFDAALAEHMAREKEAADRAVAMAELARIKESLGMKPGTKE